MLAVPQFIARRDWHRSLAAGMASYRSEGFTAEEASSWVEWAYLAPHPAAARVFHLAGRTGRDYATLRALYDRHYLGRWATAAKPGEVGTSVVEWVESTVPCDVVETYFSCGIKCAEAVAVWEPVRLGNPSEWAAAIATLQALRAAAPEAA